MKKNKVLMLRTEADMTQLELSKLTGLTCGGISLIENGDRDMALNTAGRIAAAFNVTIDYLYDSCKLSNTDLSTRNELTKLKLKLDKIEKLITTNN